MFLITHFYFQYANIGKYNTQSRCREDLKFTGRPRQKYFITSDASKVTLHHSEESGTEGQNG